MTTSRRPSAQPLPPLDAVDGDSAGELVGLRRHIGHDPARRSAVAPGDGRLAERSAHSRTAARRCWRSRNGACRGTGRQGRVAARCHAGIAHDSEMPPPSAPHCGPSFHTCSPAGWVDASVDRRAARPRRRRAGWQDRSRNRVLIRGHASGSRTCCTSSEPLSPLEEKTDWPCAAACSKRRFSASWKPGWPLLRELLAHPPAGADHVVAVGVDDRRVLIERVVAPALSLLNGPRRRRSARPARPRRRPPRRGWPRRCPRRSADRRRSGIVLSASSWPRATRRRSSRCRRSAMSDRQKRLDLEDRTRWPAPKSPCAVEPERP